MKRSLGSWHVGSRTPPLMSFQLGPKRCRKREIFGFECRRSPLFHYAVGRDDLMIHVKRRWKTAGAVSAVFPATKQYPWTMCIMITCSLLRISQLYCLNASAGLFKNLISRCRNIAMQNMRRLEKNIMKIKVIVPNFKVVKQNWVIMKCNAECQTRQRIEAAMGSSAFVGLEKDVIDWVNKLVAIVVIVTYNLTHAGAALCVVQAW